MVADSLFQRRSIRRVLILFILATALIVALTNSVSLSQKWHSNFGKTYPSNRVYQAMLEINDNLGSLPRKAANIPFGGTDLDATGYFRHATTGVSFNQVISDLTQIGAQRLTSGKNSPNELLYVVRWENLSSLKIPNCHFEWYYAPALLVTIHYSSDTNFIVDKAVIQEQSPMI